MSNIGINGFGRIGRMVLRIATERNIQIVAINDPYLSIGEMAYLFQRDSTHGEFKGTVYAEKPYLVVNNKFIIVTHITDPKEIHWCCIGAHYVVEASGTSLTLNEAWDHLEGGARKVIIAGASHCDIPTFVCGANLSAYNPKIKVLSCGSAATSCVAPFVKLIDDNYSILEGSLSVIGAISSTQNNVDGNSSQSWRFGRGNMQNIIPINTTDAKEISRVIPSLHGKLCGIGFQVPVADVSVLDLNVYLKNPTNYESIKATVLQSTKKEMKGFIKYSEEGLVSSDIITNRFSTVFDANAGIQLSKQFFKLIAWYDNEFAYAGHILDLIRYIQCKDGYVSCPYDCCH